MYVCLWESANVSEQAAKVIFDGVLEDFKLRDLAVIKQSILQSLLALFLGPFTLTSLRLKHLPTAISPDYRKRHFKQMHKNVGHVSSLFTARIVSRTLKRWRIAWRQPYTSASKNRPCMAMHAFRAFGNDTWNNAIKSRVSTSLLTTLIPGNACWIAIRLDGKC